MCLHQCCQDVSLLYMCALYYVMQNDDLQNKVMDLEVSCAEGRNNYDKVHTILFQYEQQQNSPTSFSSMTEKFKKSVFAWWVTCASIMFKLCFILQTLFKFCTVHKHVTFELLLKMDAQEAAFACYSLLYLPILLKNYYK